jgi:hypothetical protein
MGPFHSTKEKSHQKPQYFSEKMADQIRQKRAKNCSAQNHHARKGKPSTKSKHSLSSV